MDNRPDCEACGRALVNPWCGVYQLGCEKCQIRHLANAPRHVRNAAWAAVPFDQRAALKDEVRAEYRRIHGSTK